MATRDSSPKPVVRKLGIREGDRIEVSGDVGSGIRGEIKDAAGRGLVRSGDLDGAVVMVESVEEGKETLVRYRARLRESGYLWIATRKRGQENYIPQLSLVPFAKQVGLIDNKTCSIDDERSGIRFVVPRAMRSAD